MPWLPDLDPTKGVPVGLDWQVQPLPANPTPGHSTEALYLAEHTGITYAKQGRAIAWGDDKALAIGALRLAPKDHGKNQGRFR